MFRWQSKMLEQNGNWTNYIKIICFNYSYYLNSNYKTKQLVCSKIDAKHTTCFIFLKSLVYSKIILKKFVSNCSNCHFAPKFYFAVSLILYKAQWNSEVRNKLV